MNPSHYPSLELCKKLTENWFPETEMEYTEFYPIWNFEEKEIVDFKKWDFHIMGSDFSEWSWYKCPSIAELLDELPDDKIYKDKYSIYWLEIYKNIVQYANHSTDIDAEPIILQRYEWTIPNALAEIWLWLKENDLLPKK